MNEHNDGQRPMWLALLAAGWFSLGGCVSDARAAESLPPLEAPERFLPSDAAERQRIEQALPAKATAIPAKPRRLLIFDTNVGYGGHPSAKHASFALLRAGRRTGAFETVLGDDPNLFRPESLRRFDAVFFNNNVGNLFTDPALRQSLVEFIYEGGGVLGVHGTSVAFTRWPGAIEDWPEFGLLLGTRGANHKDSTERVFLHLEDPRNPVTRVFGGQDFEYRDEYFRPQDPYSRARVRVLLRIDTDKTDVNAGQARGNCYRADNDYAVAWVRNYGRGRVFYSTIAHNPYVFWDPKMIEFYLAAVQFALGDLSAPTTPSRFLTPAVRAQEQLGWRLLLEGGSSPSLFESVERAARLGLPFTGARGSQPVSSLIAKPFAPGLTVEELRRVRLELETNGVRLLSYALDTLPREPAERRAAFAFVRQVGAELLFCTAGADDLSSVEALAEEFDLRVALPPPGEAAGSAAATSGPLLERARSPRLGYCADLDEWVRLGLDPQETVRRFQDRWCALRVTGSSRLAPTAAGKWLAALAQAGRQPLIVCLGDRAPEPWTARVPTLNLLQTNILSLVARPGY